MANTSQLPTQPPLIYTAFTLNQAVLQLQALHWIQCNSNIAQSPVSPPFHVSIQQSSVPQANSIQDFYFVW